MSKAKLLYFETKFGVFPWNTHRFRYLREYYKFNMKVSTREFGNIFYLLSESGKKS